MKKTVKVLAIITMLGLFCSCGAEKNMADITQMQPELSQMKAISELATMECYYHNVAEYYKEDATGYLLWKKEGSGSVMTELLRLELIPQSLGWK